MIESYHHAAAWQRKLICMVSPDYPARLRLRLDANGRRRQSRCRLDVTPLPWSGRCSTVPWPVVAVAPTSWQIHVVSCSMYRRFPYITFAKLNNSEKVFCRWLPRRMTWCWQLGTTTRASLAMIESYHHAAAWQRKLICMVSPDYPYHHAAAWQRKLICMVSPDYKSGHDRILSSRRRLAKEINLYGVPRLKGN